MVFFDRQGRAVDLWTWTHLLGDWTYKRVAGDLLAFPTGHVRVSTVWLGVDHSFGLSLGPLIFETMVFGGRHDGFQWRYVSEGDALVGHSIAVEAVRFDHRRRWLSSRLAITA